MKKPNPFDYICNYYKVPAKKNGRVEYTDSDGTAKPGTIVGVDGAHLRIRLDGEKRVGNYHPTWNIKYL
jgi:hypothetical protein